MTNDPECRECYKKTLARIRDYMKSQCKEGESISVEVYGRYGDSCYLSVDYHTIREKEHISISEHLPVGFMAEKYIVECTPQILDAMLKIMRGES